MLTLAIECATEACSVALFDRGDLVDGRYEVLGRGHAERLVPMIAELPDKGRAVRILVSLGPGSFTGVRIGLAAARALGIAWGAKVLGYPTLALVAAMAKKQADKREATVCMAGGHGEWFLQDFDRSGVPTDDVVSLSPDKAAGRAVHRLVAGSRAEELVARLEGDHSACTMLPDARQAMLLPDTVLTTALAPIYGRGPDARLPESRR